MTFPGEMLTTLFDLLDFFPRLLSYSVFRYDELNGDGLKKGSP